MGKAGDRPRLVELPYKFMMKKLKECTLFFDGAATPSNPGNCSCGAVIDLPNGEEIVLSESLGWNTNNWGEYHGLIIGCKKALELGINGT